MSTPLGFADFAPDLDRFRAAHIARNVLPGVDGYLPMPSPVVYSSSALNSKYLGGTIVRSQSGVAYNFLGTKTKLYRLLGAGLTDATRLSGGDYNASTWRFVLWQNQVIATSLLDDVQVITLGGANFTALSGSPPRAKYAAILSDDFVMLGNLIDSGTDYHSRVHWSAYRDITNWTPDTETQSDFRDLEASAGAVQGLVGGESGICFQERRISSISLIGVPHIFRFDKITEEIGAICPNAIATKGHDTYFIGQEGFAVILGGAQYQRIGHGRVDRTFFSDIKPNHYDNVVVGVQQKTGRIWWAYPGSGSSMGVPNKQLIFDPSLNKWTQADLIIEGFQYAAEPTVTSDELDSTYATSDAANLLVDADVFAGGLEEFATFGPDHRMRLHTGPSLEAYVQTQEIELNKGRRTIITSALPIGDAIGSMTLDVGYRSNRNEPQAKVIGLSKNRYNEYDILLDARYHQLTATLSGDWKLAVGIDVETKPSSFK